MGGGYAEMVESNAFGEFLDVGAEWGGVIPSDDWEYSFLTCQILECFEDCGDCFLIVGVCVYWTVDPGFWGGVLV